MHRVSSVHTGWNHDFEPVLEVDPGAVVELTVPDASYDQIGKDMTAAGLETVDFGRVNPVAGPVFVRGAAPGDVLEAEILEVRTRSWGWTAIVPGFGGALTSLEERYAALPRFATVDELIAEGKFDTAVVCLPNDATPAAIEKLAAAGKPILTEKPCGKTAADFAAAAKLVRTKKLAFQNGYMWRYDAGADRLREMVAEGRLGKLSHIETAFVTISSGRRSVKSSCRSAANGSPSGRHTWKPPSPAPR